MNSLIVENVRCFHDRQRAVLRPVTVLVGENSSGKSTFLGLVRLVWKLGALRWTQIQDLDFNAEPFGFGSYDQIATFRGGRGGLAKSISIGAEFQPPLVINGPYAASIQAAYVPRQGQPTLSEWSLKRRVSNAGSAVERGEYAVTFLPQAQRLIIETPGGRLEAHGSSTYLFSALRADSSESLETLDIDWSGGLPPDEHRRISSLASSLPKLFGPEPYAFAPIRTKPLRTYDPITEEARPEGSHVPVVLARMAAAMPEAWAALGKALTEFGRHSGLFDVVNVRRMGRKDSDPFQIQIKATGPAFNLVDVGYGVSQILPILVDCSRGKAARTFLLQQPEVHLHPRAQAALGSWLAALAKVQAKRFVIETHSDHFVDRLRMDVRDGKFLKPWDVSILYFERRRGSTVIHHLDLDRRGNFVRVPEGYRSFFLEEERRLLGG